MGVPDTRPLTRRTRLKALLTIAALAGAIAPAGLMVTKAAAADPSHVSFTLEGCRGSAADFPASGPFVCDDSLYTTGNLGGGWNELDLVPFRIVAAAGNSAPLTQTYQIAEVADNSNAGHPGYDVISVPTLDSKLSNGTCAISASPPDGAGTILTPGIGGTGTSIFRLLTIGPQSANTTCVYDLYARLALGSHLYPGSSLHTNLALPVFSSGVLSGLTTSGIGARDVSIPVNQIAPQQLSKSMGAIEGSDHTWNVVKTQTPARIDFTQSCNPGNATTAPVTVTITWTRSPADPSGPVMVTTDITATNPSHRQIQVNVTDTVFSGTTAVTPLTGTNPFSTSFLADANTTTTITHTITVAQGTTALNDHAVATYTDLVTGIPVPGTTDATATAAVQFTGPQTNQTAVVTDDTSISGADLSYSIDSSAPSPFGTFSDLTVPGTYTLGTPTTDSVRWTSPTLSDSGSIQFNETVSLDAPAITSGTLGDTASLLGSDAFTASAPATSTSISAEATVALTIDKSMPADVTGAQTFSFAVSGPGGYSSTQSVTVTPPATTGSTTVTGLAPGTYTVHENTAAPWLAQPDQSTTITVTPGSFSSCSGAVGFSNSFPPAGASVRKVTIPAGHEAGWAFVLTGPGIVGTIGSCPAGVSVGECVTTGGTAAVPFTFSLLQGTYTVTEVSQPGWDETGASLNGTAQAGPACTFTVVYPADSGQPFACVFTNRERSAVEVIKTQSRQPLSGTEAFDFRLTGPGGYSNTQTANAGNAGTLIFGLVGGVPQLVPGTYTLCELALGPGWSTTLATLPGATTDPTTGNVCVSFPLGAGVFNPPFTFTVDNTPPPGGGQRTIGFWKNWSCMAPGHQTDKLSPLLPQPLGAFMVTTCSEAVTVLSNPSSKFAENQLAAQLLAAELNVAAGASTCLSITTAILQANALLATVGYNPLNAPTQLIGANSPFRAQATSLASLLNSYNNGLVC